jgi:regulator of protease activity HflC (stomatin/prohibitin superfamily)
VIISMSLMSLMSTMAMSACGQAPAPVPPVPPSKVQLAVIPAESDAFPKAARAVSASLAAAKVSGIDETRVSKVSLEVVQLSVECVDPTSACYEAIGRSMAANRLLFARIDRGTARRQLKITVTLFDVDAKAEQRTAAKVFATEAEATAGAAALVEEVTR